jgi:hypothetical protein
MIATGAEHAPWQCDRGHRPRRAITAYIAATTVAHRGRVEREPPDSRYLD